MAVLDEVLAGLFFVLFISSLSLFPFFSRVFSIIPFRSFAFLFITLFLFRLGIISEKKKKKMLGEKARDIACIPWVQFIPCFFHSLSISSRGMSIVHDVGYCVCSRGGEKLQFNLDFESVLFNVGMCTYRYYMFSSWIFLHCLRLLVPCKDRILPFRRFGIFNISCSSWRKYTYPSFCVHVYALIYYWLIGLVSSFPSSFNQNTFTSGTQCLGYWFDDNKC